MSKKSSKSLKERALGVKVGSKVNSSVKGSTNERAIAKALSEWTGKTFRRVPTSGAIHVPLTWLNGDLFCTDQNFRFPFTVECKHYHSIYPKLWQRWWEQVVRDAEEIDRHPMLIYRLDGWKAGTWLVVTSPNPFRFYKLGLRFDYEMDEYTGLNMHKVIIQSYDLFKIDYQEFLKCFP